MQRRPSTALTPQRKPPVVEAALLTAVLVAGVSFAIPQYLVSNFHGPWLVDIAWAIVSIVITAN